MGEFCQILMESSARDATMAGYYSLTFLFCDRSKVVPLLQFLFVGVGDFIRVLCFAISCCTYLHFWCLGEAALLDYGIF